MTNLTAWIGIYGAVVATGLLIWNIVKDRPRIKIEIWGIPDNKSDKYDIKVTVINKSSYPFKIDFYGFEKKRRIGGVSQPYFEELQIPSRDQHILNFGISDIKLEFKDDEMNILDTFYVVDRTTRVYKKKVPSYILKQAQITSIGKKFEN